MLARALPPACLDPKKRMPDTPDLHQLFRNRGSQSSVALAHHSARGCSLSPVSSTRISPRARERRFHPMPGQLVDVGGYKLHIDCTGQGSPTVILDCRHGRFLPLLAQSAAGDRKVHSRLFLRSRRPRLQRFQPSPPHQQSVRRGTARPPAHTPASPVRYVLVGHSMGGFDVRLYASLYRNEVAGMVLVDSSHPEQQKRLPPAINDLDATWLREQEFFEFTMPFGIPRLLGFCGKTMRVRAADCNFHTVRESVAELKSISESAAQTANRRLTRRHAARRALARSRHASARSPGRPGQAHQRCLATDAGRISPPLDQRHAGDREKQRTLHSARSPRLGSRQPFTSVVDQARQALQPPPPKPLAKQSTSKPANVNFFPSRLHLPSREDEHGSSLPHCRGLATRLCFLFLLALSSTLVLRRKISSQTRSQFSSRRNPSPFPVPASVLRSAAAARSACLTSACLQWMEQNHIPVDSRRRHQHGQHHRRHVCHRHVARGNPEVCREH